jgi:signal transduction histidine kinase
MPLLGPAGHAERAGRALCLGMAGGREGRMRALRLPGRTVRVRLTATYGILFFVSGAVLLAIASGVTVVRSSSQVSVAAHQATPGSALAQAQARIVTLQGQLQHVQAASESGEGRLRANLLVASLIALAIMTVLSVALGWLVAGRALRPLRQMTATAQRISEDNLDERLALRGPTDELKELGDTIDGLLERLEVAFSAQRRFVANASHELRTPLTTMRAALDVALAKPEPAPPQTVALAGRLRTEVSRMERLLEAFLVLARAQHRSMPGQAVLPLDYIVSSALADQAVAIRAMDLTVQDTSRHGGAWVAGSQALLSRMVENVIDNAVGHNTPGGWIAITTGSRGGGARLVIENGGPVLDQQQVAELAQPFRRLEADRIGTDQGSGLGLSIVAAIAEAHGGTLDLFARPGGGLRVCVELPAVTASAAAPAGAPA